MPTFEMRCVGILLWLLQVFGAWGFQCESDIQLGPISSKVRKGLAVDDTTFQHCSAKIPWVWPNTWDPVSSLRLFKAWSPDWSPTARETAWQNLVAFVESNQATVLIGTQVTCNPEDDDEDWAWTKELIKRFNPKNIMGVAVGNELDLIYTKVGVDPSITDECVSNLWSKGRVWTMFERRRSDLDEMGFKSVIMTSVFTGAALSGNPFLESGTAAVNSFLRNASESLGQRFAFTFNFYPYFDGGFKLDAPLGETTRSGNCSTAIGQAACFNASCQVPQSSALTRSKIAQLTGDANRLFWIGETGWSSPAAESLQTEMEHCPAWSSSRTFTSYYANFLSWEVTSGSPQSPDHVFYFDIRDSTQFGVSESFGLIEDCAATACKLRSSTFVGPESGPHEASISWLRYAWVGLGVCMIILLLAIGVYVRIRKGMKDTRALMASRKEPV